MTVRILIVVLCLLTLVGCGTKYPSIEPGTTETGQISFTGVDGSPVAVTVMYSVPPGYTPEKQWPLVIALHGHGSRAAAFHDLWKPVTDSLGMILVTPQGEESVANGFGYGWGENAVGVVQATMNMISQSVPVASRRVFLAGFSAGGMLAWDMAIHFPFVFRGVALLGAPVDIETVPRDLPDIGHLRVYIGYGSLEERIAERVPALVEILQRHGAEVRVNEYEGIGHALPDPVRVELLHVLEHLDSVDRATEPTL
ncbi:MAG: dienelactone hydrolase family protein [candidate division Zixibacteria bacterium]|nr:dienelactone hydrolase family protein [candidate division Zixibacteria bacterium]